MAAIGQVSAASDMTALRLSVHPLTGTLHYFGKTVAFEEVFRLERVA